VESNVLQDTTPERQFWNDYLDGSPEMLLLPTDAPRTSLPPHPVDYVALKIPGELTRRLRSIAQQNDATLISALLSALAIVLSRWSNQQEVILGVALAERQQPEVTSASGLVENVLPVRLWIRDHETLEQLLQQVEATSAKVRGHQSPPAGGVAALRPDSRQLDRPLFQVVLGFNDRTVRELLLATESTAREPAASAIGRSELAFVLASEEGEGLQGWLGYASSLFSRNTIDRLVAHWKALLKDLATNPRRPIGSLRMLTEWEREQVLRTFNGTAEAFRTDRLVHELFEEQVLQAPGMTAVEHEDQRLTFAELNSKANQLARRLRAAGVGPDVLVGMFLYRGVEVMVAVLGILKAGGAYVPLDPSHPSDRVSYILKDASPQAIVTTEMLGHRLPPHAGTRVYLDSQWSQIAVHDDTNLDPRMMGLASCHLAYVIYTSGSTGKPNGVMVEHRNVVNHWNVVSRLYRRPIECRRIAVNAPFTFDVSVQQFVLLLSGCTLVIVPEPARQDWRQLFDFLQASRVEGLDCTPSQLNTWTAAGFLDRGGFGVRTLIVGGEALDAALWTRLTQRSDIVFYNVYGPTECTVFSTATPLSGAGATPHIGRPTSNSYVFILDSQLRPVPVGVTGEIFIGGSGVARGYLNRPQLTRDRFIRDPFSKDPQARLYRTGDLARWHTKGNIEFLGRTDHQVKVRGFRIELGEIAIQLLRHPQVSDAVVIAREDLPGDKRLVAYVTTHNGPDFSSGPRMEELRAHLESALPEYMIPSAFIVLNSFPLTANGKLDRQALPAPDSQDHLGQRFEPPQGEMEEALAAIWQDVLRVQKIGRDSKFLELGGHSVQGMRVVVRVAERFGIQMSFPDLFQHPTVRQMAELVRTRKEQTTSEATPRPLTRPA
jgi:amino acid adenylation domain-containing protein